MLSVTSNALSASPASSEVISSLRVPLTRLIDMASDLPLPTVPLTSTSCQSALSRTRRPLTPVMTALGAARTAPRSTEISSGRLGLPSSFWARKKRMSALLPVTSRARPPSSRNRPSHAHVVVAVAQFAEIEAPDRLAVGPETDGAGRRQVTGADHEVVDGLHLVVLDRQREAGEAGHARQLAPAELGERQRRVS